MIRCFLAHSISDDDDRISALCSQIKNAVLAEDKSMTEDEVEVVTGRDDFRENAATNGGWKGWPESVSTRVDAETGTSFFDMIVLPTPSFGKGTAEILRHAFANMTAAFLLKEGKLIEATELKMDNSKDFKNGWSAS